jgi:hypothetical protein
LVELIVGDVGVVVWAAEFWSVLAAKSGVLAIPIARTAARPLVRTKVMVNLQLCSVRATNEPGGFAMRASRQCERSHGGVLG